MTSFAPFLRRDDDAGVRAGEVAHEPKLDAWSRRRRWSYRLPGLASVPPPSEQAARPRVSARPAASTPPRRADLGRKVAFLSPSPSSGPSSQMPSPGEVARRLCRLVQLADVTGRYRTARRYRFVITPILFGYQTQKPWSLATSCTSRRSLRVREGTPDISTSGPRGSAQQKDFPAHGRVRRRQPAPTQASGVSRPRARTSRRPRSEPPGACSACDPSTPSGSTGTPAAHSTRAAP